jgi:hypothetical protein
MKIEGQTGARSGAERDREPWEPCSIREEVGITVFYIAERLCYRVAFLLCGVCNQRLLAVADYWQAKRERLAPVRRGLREEGNSALLAGQKARSNGHGAVKR